MALQAARQFIEKLLSDSGFNQKFKKYMEAKPVAWEDITRVAGQDGFMFTKDEFIQMGQEMDKKEVQDFLLKIRTDPAFKNKMKTRLSGKNSVEFVKIAAEEGYHFSVMGYRIVIQENASLAHELPVEIDFSDEELAAVAGGYCGMYKSVSIC